MAGERLSLERSLRDPGTASRSGARSSDSTECAGSRPRLSRAASPVVGLLLALAAGGCVQAPVTPSASPTTTDGAGQPSQHATASPSPSDKATPKKPVPKSNTPHADSYFGVGAGSWTVQGYRFKVVARTDTNCGKPTGIKEVDQILAPPTCQWGFWVRAVNLSETPAAADLFVARLDTPPNAKKVYAKLKKIPKPEYRETPPKVLEDAKVSKEYQVALNRLDLGGDYLRIRKTGKVVLFARGGDGRLPVGDQVDKLVSALVKVVSDQESADQGG